MNRNTVVALPPVDYADWEDYHLTKDCGMVPYLLHKRYGMDVSMVGTVEDLDEYPSKEMVPGLKLVPMPHVNVVEKTEYLIENGAEIDVLVLYGMYVPNMAMAITYKAVNPDGFVYVALDANSRWIPLINTEDELFRNFISCVDLMATSCRSLAMYLTVKWGRKIECITNGYYNWLGDAYPKCVFEDKENTILTVSRLGTEQKATDVLLEAFAGVARDIPGWSLKLIGHMEEDFQAYLRNYFSEHPDLKERVIFTGVIKDKKHLAEEYEKAKIFALPSRWEGGNPNVISEALTAGCVTAVTKFDAWADCIADGKCGAAVEVDDAVGFGACLKSLCLGERLWEMSETAREHADDFYNMEKNVDFIYRKLMGQ